MAATRTRMSWIAIGMVASFNLFCWLPASVWAFTVAASIGFVFVFAARPAWFGMVLAILSFAAGMITSRFLPYGYMYYFAGFWSVLVLSPSIIMATAIRRGLSAYKAQLLALLPVSAVMILYQADVGNVATVWKQVLNEVDASTVDLYREAMRTLPSSLSPEEMNLLKASIASFFDFVYRFFSGLVICWAATMNIVSYYFAARMIRGDGGFCRKLRDFVLWKHSLASMILLAFGLLLLMIDIGSLMPFAENALFILVVSYSVVGFAVIEYYLKRKRIHAAVRVAFYLLLMLTGWIGGLLTAIVGLVDSHFDFRRVRAQQIG